MSPGVIEIDVQDGRMPPLIRYWPADQVFSTGQITIFNRKLNQLLTHARTPSLTINQTLLNNTKPLRLSLRSKFELTNEVLDDILIIAIENPSYNIERINGTTYQVQLDKG